MTERIVAWDREETDYCERSTFGCSIDHTEEAKAGLDVSDCEGW